MVPSDTIWNIHITTRYCTQQTLNITMYIHVFTFLLFTFVQVIYESFFPIFVIVNKRRTHFLDRRIDHILQSIRNNTNAMTVQTWVPVYL